MISFQPGFEEIRETPVAADFSGREMVVIINDGQNRSDFVVQSPGGGCCEEKILIHELFHHQDPFQTP
jgi:hypothetical protein